VDGNESVSVPEAGLDTDGLEPTAPVGTVRGRLRCYAKIM
jgi:hypothetical protein